MGYFSQRVDFDVKEFYRTILQKGYEVIWEKSAVCPCLEINYNGQPRVGCSLCNGKGRFWFDPMRIRVVMTSMTNTERFERPGEIVTGSCYVTTLPEYKLGFWDRLTAEDSRIRYSEIVVHGRMGESDKLKFKPVEIELVRTVEREYRKGLDWVMSEDGVSWLPTGLEPSVGEKFTVEYMTRPRWIVIDLVNVIRDTYVKAKRPGEQFSELPVRALARLEFFV